MTAKQRHRAGVIAAAGRDPSCALEHRGGCRGRLEADHVVELGWLTEWFGRARYRRNPVPCVRCGGTGALAVLAAARAVGATDAAAEVDGAAPAPCPDCAGTGDALFDTITADERNGWLLCERHHGLKTAGLILPPIMRDELPDELDEFLIDYRCAHLLNGRAAFGLA